MVKTQDSSLAGSCVSISAPSLSSALIKNLCSARLVRMPLKFTAPPLSGVVKFVNITLLKESRVGFA